MKTYNKLQNTLNKVFLIELIIATTIIFVGFVWGALKCWLE